MLEQELRSLAQRRASGCLSSATDATLLQNLFAHNDVQLVFHAAAYKHVPLVESNPLAGLTNNVGSTFQVCRAALSTGVHQVLLISTDKAVRPTNVMGASKRLAELVLQAFAAENSSTLFAMVRFGNVLGSSGSVVPLFRRQIAQGGPITLTHPEIIRYFMTIPEAHRWYYRLPYSKGVMFFFRYGRTGTIKTLAEQMLQLSVCHFGIRQILMVILG